MMVNWSDQKHAVGIPDIDAQHKELFLITNLLAQAGESPVSAGRSQIICNNLKRLLAYCHYHFNTEEEILGVNAYPELGVQQEQHRGFTDQVKRYLAESRQKPNLALGPILDELVNWILFHIQDEDRKFAAWFVGRGIRVSAHPCHSGTGVTTADDALAVWNDKKLGLDIKGIDDQHRELVMILQQANDLLKASPERQHLFLPVIIKKLFYYSQFHFSSEEELMSRSNWTGLPEHQDQHRLFIKRIVDFSAEYNARTQGLSAAIVGFLKDWTIHHILEEDRKFKDALKP